MRFYNRQHRHYCGIDLHVKTMYVCILDATGRVLVHRNMTSTPEAFLETIAPYRDDLVVAAECLFTWYWVADLCAAQEIPFVLGHALAMKAIHGGKAKNDKIDLHKIASLLRGGLLPQAYVYPAGMRCTRDLLRRRLHLVRKRGELLGHIQKVAPVAHNTSSVRRISTHTLNEWDGSDSVSRFRTWCPRTRLLVSRIKSVIGSSAQRSALSRGALSGMGGAVGSSAWFGPSRHSHALNR